ncbi:hypothetical protein TeGR_g6626 [Tetraparma gracilis]|uniref:Sugar phosphate transporter domain-containing protein n=1 Tax=Tetraparma gracilis TaxID=2962635 RepID=A0ABQ6N311_9STRA|nr:hypothetical protein TeGR_g6626 [Tetraparma gracilis]
MAPPTSNLKLALFVGGWYAGNTVYNIYNKKATNSIHAHWFVAGAQLGVGILLSLFLWATGLRKTPNLNSKDIISCVPIGFCAAGAHGGSVLAMGVGAVSFAQIIKACEPVFAAIIGLLVPPIDIKPIPAYLMLLVICGGVGLACVKEGKGVEINMLALQFASFANVCAAFKGKWGHSVTGALKADKSKNMDAANVYALMNILSFLWTVPMIIIFEMATLREEWEKAVNNVGAQELIFNITMSAIFFYFYNEMAFAFTSQVGAVTSSVLNTAKRVIIIVASAIVFQEGMSRNKMVGSAIAILGTGLYSVLSKKAPAKTDKKKD